MIRVARFAAWAGMLVGAAACVRPTLVEPPASLPSTSAPEPSARRDWTLATAEVERLELEGNPQAVDSTLVAFMQRWPGTPEAEEGAWWRLLRQADRAEDSASMALVVVRIDSVLTANPASPRRVEMRVLRRALALTQQLRSERNATRLERDAARQRADETEKLRAELEEARAELARVRNRVIRRRP